MAGEQFTGAHLCDTWACAFVHVYDNGGVGVIAFFGLAFLFYRLIWKVWRAMLASKDEEIERLTRERNYYQDLLFPGRQTSNGDGPRVARDDEKLVARTGFRQKLKG